MKAQILNQITDLSTNASPLQLTDIPKPVPREKEILLKVLTCGVCHTELDEIEGRTPPPQFPVVLGHQVVGEVVEMGANSTVHKIGDRLGVGWVHLACGECEYCLQGLENLCELFTATGRDVHGGYAEFMVVPELFAIPIPKVFSDEEAAPLLCAGAIGYRSLKLSGIKAGQNLGLMGFGASAHLVLKLVKHQFPNTKVYVFARSENERKFALELRADWSGDIDEKPPELLNSVIDTTPAWKPIVETMSTLKPGGRLVINAIRKEDRDKDYLKSISYQDHLWLEKEIKSVANVTRQDISEFLLIAGEIPIKPEVQVFSLDQANQALLELKNRKIRGAKVLKIAT